MRQGVDMKDGFVKVAALTPPCKVADTAFNADAIAALVAEYAAKGCKLIVFPEMAVTGYTVADLLTQDALLDASDAALLSIAKKTAKSDCAVVVGAPVRADGKLYDCAAVLNGGRVVGVVPKTSIPNYGEFYEGRYIEMSQEVLPFITGCVIPKLADLVIASCGGFPKDINVYQMQKTMDNAMCAVREGGVVVLLADCEEGSGSKVLEETFRRLKTPEAIKAELEANFRIGANKAFAITRPISHARYILVTRLDRQLAKDMLFTGAVDTVEEALEIAKQYVGDKPSIILMPEGSLTVPRVE